VKRVLQGVARLGAIGSQQKNRPVGWRGGGTPAGESDRHVLINSRCVPIEITPADPSLSQCSPALASVVGLLSQRHTQTLLGMLRGLSEKQVARALHISPHTVHVYVKRLYRQFDVQSRGELIGKFVAPAEIAALEAKTPVRFEPIRPMPKKPTRVFTHEQVLSIREALMSVRWSLR